MPYGADDNSWLSQSQPPMFPYSSNTDNFNRGLVDYQDPSLYPTQPQQPQQPKKDSAEIIELRHMKMREEQLLNEAKQLYDKIEELRDQNNQARSIVEERSSCSHIINHTKECNLCASVIQHRNRFYVILITILIAIIALLLIMKKKD